MYSVSMKILMLIAAVLLAPMSVRAQAVFSEAARAEFMKELEADRIALLPQMEPLPPVTVKHQPRLNAIKTEAAAAGTAAQLAKARASLAAWKTVVLNELFVANKKTNPGETFPAFSARRENEINFVIALRQQFAAQRVASEASAVRTASRSDGSWMRFFDNQAPTAGKTFQPAPVPAVSDGAVKVEPLAGAARYKKLRDIAVRDWHANPSIVDAAINEAMRQNVDPALVLAVIYQESGFSTKAKSPVGARGLMQIMPSTGKGMGVSNPDDLYDMQTNLRLGVKYLRNAAGYLKLDINLADIASASPAKLKALLASYNAGCGAVTKWLREQGSELVSIPYAETRHYVAAISKRIYGLGS